MILDKKQSQILTKILKDYGAVCSDDDYMGEFGREACHLAHGAVEELIEDVQDQANERDLRSLREMKACADKLQDAFDGVELEKLSQLIEDWVDELEALK